MNFSEKVSAKLDVQPVADITHAWQHCKDNGRPPAPAPSCCCCSLFPTALPHNGNCKYRARYAPVGSPARWSVNPVGKESVSLHARCVPGALDSARSREGLRETETRKCGFTHSARYLFFTLREHFLKSGGKRVKVISLLKSNGKCCLQRKSRCDVHGHAGLCLERRPRGLTCSTWSGGHPAGLSSQGPSGAEGCPGNQVGGLPCIPTHPGRGKVDGVDEKWEKDSSHFAVQSAVDEGLHSRMFLIS